MSGLALWILAGLGVVLLPLLLRPGALLLVYLAGVFAASRAFAVIGVPPLYVGDILIGLAILASLLQAAIGSDANSETRPPASSSALVSFLLLVLGILILISVVRGASAGHPESLKLASLALACLAAATISHRLGAAFGKDSRLLLGVSLLGVPGYFVLAIFQGFDSLVAAAYGLTFSVAACLLLERDFRMGTRISGLTWLWTALALLGLMLASKRGPILTFALAGAVAYILVRRAKQPDSRTVVVGGLLTIGATLGIGFFALAWASRLPVFGPTLTRLAASTAMGSESEANLSLRLEVWEYCIAAAIEKPILGGGSGAPILVNFRGVDFADFHAGPHNSFVALAYYAGFPALLVFLALLTLAFRKAWRMRTVPLGAAQLAILVAVVLTCSTNVALEAPYIGTPILLLISWIATGAGHSDEPVADSRRSIRGERT